MLVCDPVALLPVLLCAKGLGRQQEMAWLLVFLPLTWGTPVKFVARGFGMLSLGWCGYLEGE